MIKQQFRAALKALRLSCDEFADLTSWSLATIYTWGDSTLSPHSAGVIIALLA
jgi:hypothetical protein